MACQLLPKRLRAMNSLVEARVVRWMFTFITLHLIALRHDFSLDNKLAFFAFLSGHQVLRFYLSLSLSAGAMGAYRHAWLWGFMVAGDSNLGP